MTPEQYKHWKDFAFRMARTCYATNRRPSRDWIVDVLDDFFYELDDADYVGSIISWDDSDGTNTCVSDHVTLLLDEYEDLADYRCPSCRSHCYLRDADNCQCEEIRAAAYTQWDDQWGGPVHCCIRAGLDMASAPSAGVIGFTAGQVRRMYPEGVPDWVFPPDERLRYWPNGPVNGTFRELADNAGVVL
jgi:hypothetical protein